jgi:di/tricarboxylate transporter
MTFEIGLLIAVVGLAILLFSFEWFSADVVALGILITLILTQLVPAKQAFLGFGSDTVVMTTGLLVLTAALMRTGVMDLVGRSILRHAGENPDRLLLVIMITSAVLGAFMSNTASTAFFIPIVIGIAQRGRFSASALLLPLAFSSILSSSVTLISTSTNLVVSGLMNQYGMAPMGMFELAPVGIPITVAGLLYMFFIGRRLLPVRANPTELAEGFGLRPYLTEIMILPTSSLVGKTLAESGLGNELDLTVLRVVRDKDQYYVPKPSMKLQPNDVLLVEGTSEDILKIKDTAGIEIKADVKLADPNLQSEDIALVEVILMPTSSLLRQTLKKYRFRERYGLQVLGINRRGKNILRKISQVPLRMGDVLLLQGRKENIAALADDHTFNILGAVEEKRPNRKLALRASVIFMGALLLGTFKIVSLPVAVLIGATLAFVTKCITPQEAYREVEWKAPILIGSMLALGVAMENTGTAKYLASLLVNLSDYAGPLWLLAGFFVLTVILTQPMSNQAAAVVMLPVAVQSAVQLHLNPRTFAMMVAIAASCSYLTPLEPSCLMVYGPGRYRFADFLKVGSLLTILIFVIAILLVPRVWPLK